MNQDSSNPPNVSLDMGNSGAPSPSQGGPQVRVNPDIVNTRYFNFVVGEATPEEVILNLAFHPHLSSEIDITDRVVLNYHTAKRLAGILGEIVQHYETNLGPIPLGPVNEEQRPK